MRIFDLNCHFLLQLSSFFNRIGQLSQPEYVPSDADLLHIHIGRRGACYTYFESQRVAWTVLDASRSHGGLKMLKGFYALVSSVLFTVDLADYARLVNAGEPNVTYLHSSLADWDSIAKSRRYSSTKMAICFINVAGFAQSLKRIPLTQRFGEIPELDDPSDAEQAKEYIIGRFTALSKTHGESSLKTFLCQNLPMREDWAVVKDFLCTRRELRPSLADKKAYAYAKLFKLSGLDRKAFSWVKGCSEDDNGYWMASSTHVLAVLLQNS